MRASAKKQTKKKAFVLLCLKCWAHCDVLNQSLDGAAGRHLKRDFVDFQVAEMWTQSAAHDFLPLKAVDHIILRNLWLQCEAAEVSAVPSFQLSTRSDPCRLILTAVTHTHSLQTHRSTQGQLFELHRLDRPPPARLWRRAHEHEVLTQNKECLKC